MIRISTAIYLCAAPAAVATSIPLINPGGEVNTGVDLTPISAPEVIGWDSDGGKVINNGIDFGNGGWRFSFEDSESLWQMSGHTITSGDSYSLRFDAAPFVGEAPVGEFTADLTLVGPGVHNGDFNADTSAADSRTFAETPEWFNLGTAGNGSQATRTTLPVDGTRNAVMAANPNQRVFAIDTGHTLSAGEVFFASYEWRDASNWNDAADRVGVTLFTTADDSPTGARSVIQMILSAPSTANSTFEVASALFAPTPAQFDGKRLFASFEAIDGNADNAGFGRLDNFVLQRGSAVTGPVAREVTAELYVDGAGGRQVVAGRRFALKSDVDNSWSHYHLAVPAGALDEHAGKALGVQFRSGDAGDERFQSVDHVRLDYWPAGAPDGAFVDHWDQVPDQVWAGPGYWANRLHDWEVRSGRVNCILGSRDRRTVHRVGTTVRGNGGGLALAVRTGLHAGSDGGNARSGFLIGAGPSLDWRGALLVHDGLGRDFGLFAGIRSDGKAVIEDYSTNAVTQIAAGPTPAGGFPTEARLSLSADYDGATGEYELTLRVADGAGVELSTAAVRVSSDRVLGSFGLLSHRGTNSAQFWFDDFSGTGAALNPEPERHLAILGAMYTLSRGILKLNAQLSPIDLASTPPLALEIWDGSAWNQVATAPVDNTDGLSSYTATFRITGWDDTVDTDYRLRLELGGTPHYWTGTVRRDPVHERELVIAATTCQRICDGNPQSNGFDWSPVRCWQPHTLAFAHLQKHDPDLFIANGDQIYEGQPTGEDSTTDFNRQHDYLYKWYLWVLQSREVTRRMPSIVEPDDHDVFQGNLWGEGGGVSTMQNDGGYEEPASWVKLVDRTQTAHLPDPDPFNPLQPPPPIGQGIGVYFTGMVYGGVGFAILEDRKFKTGPLDPPADPEQQFLLGDRQKDFLRAWNTDWDGQAVKCVVSQSPFGNLHTHAGRGYNRSLTDRDAHGWPLHRRNEVWSLLRQSRMFQIAGDQHLATVAQHGIDAPADAGYSFTVPAIANFFPRTWDPVHTAAGPTPVISPNLGDFFFDGVGTLPTGEPNPVAPYPAHVRMFATANPLEYHRLSRGIDPANLHDRGAGYGIVRIDKPTQRVSFECWPLHADPEFPSTGAQFAGWPITISQRDNDGRPAAGFLPPVETGRRKNPVILVYDESDGSLVYSMRARGNLVRPPVYDLSRTYRVEILHDGQGSGTSRSGQTPTPPAAAAIRSFSASQAAITSGASATLAWDVDSPVTLTLDGGDVLPLTVDGVGYLEVSPTADTTYTLSLNGAVSATASVSVFAPYPDWLAANFSPAERLDAAVSGEGADPDLDGWRNRDEFLFQTDPRSAGSGPGLSATLVEVGGAQFADFSSPTPLGVDVCQFVIESGSDLSGWAEVPAEDYAEVSRGDDPVAGTPRVTVRLHEFSATPTERHFYRGRWIIGEAAP